MAHSSEPPLHPNQNQGWEGGSVVRTWQTCEALSGRECSGYNSWEEERKLKQEDCHDFEPSVGYIVRSRLDLAIVWDTVTIKKNPEKNEESNAQTKWHLKLSLSMTLLEEGCWRQTSVVRSTCYFQEAWDGSAYIKWLTTAPKSDSRDANVLL